MGKRINIRKNVEYCGGWCSEWRQDIGRPQCGAKQQVDEGQWPRCEELPVVTDIRSNTEQSIAPV